MTDTVDIAGGAGALAAASALLEGLEQLAGAALWPLGDGDLADLAGLLDRVRRLADGQTVRLLGEVGSRGLPGQDGTGTPGAWLRKVAPTLRPAEAAGLAKQAHVLYHSRLAPELAPTRQALEAGTVRVGQARVVTETVEKLSAPHVPTDGPEAVDPDQVTAAQRQRCLALSTEASGMTFLQGLLTKEAGAALKTALDAWSAPHPAADGTPDPRTAAQRRHDALQTLAETTLARGDVPTSHGSPAKVIVRVTAETLTTAALSDDIKVAGLAPAELDDGTPISRTTLARIACTADLVPVLLDDLGQPLDVGRTVRLHTPRQRTALIERDRGCTWPGCTAPASWCQAHHLTPWQHGGRTDVSDAALLCGRHHRHAHTTGATGQVVDGHVLWTPPGAPPDADPPPEPRRRHRHYLHRLTGQWLVPRRE